jgi:hypothetical protein
MINPTPTLSLPLKGRAIAMFLLLMRRIFLLSL